MERIEVEAFATEVNAWIVRTPGRKFPALVLQGDSFSVFFALAQSLLERLRTAPSEDPETVKEAEELRNLLWGRLKQYEEVLREHGLPLPYVRDKWPQ